jgi:integrase
MGRRARGDGAVYYDETRGVWVGQVDLGRDPATGRRRRPKVSAPTKTEAKRLLDELRREKDDTGTVARRDRTVEQVVTGWLASPPREVKSRVTRRTHADAGKKIISALGRTPLVKLTAADVEHFLCQLAADGYSTSVIVGTRSVLVRSITRAMRLDQIGRNVAALAETPEGTRRRSKAMTVEQVNALFAAAVEPAGTGRWPETSFWHAYTVSAVMLGLRPGEMLGLRWQDVDFAKRRVQVRTRLDDTAGSLTLEPLKTASSRRTLKMPDAVIAVLTTLQTEQLDAGITAQLVFCGAAGEPRWPSGVRQHFKVLCARAGLPGDWHPHEQRHTFTSVLSDADVNIEKISDALGHKNSTVTKVVYRHQIADEVTAAAVTMDGVFSDSGAVGSRVRHHDEQ